MTTKEQIVADLVQLYQKKDFNAMQVLIEKDHGSLSPQLANYYLGLASVGKGELGLARYHLEKSLHDGNASPQLLTNLKIVNANITANDIGTSADYGDRALGLMSVIPVQFYITVGLLLLVLFLLRQIIRPMRWMKCSVSILACFLILGLTCFYTHHLATAICITKSDVKTGPASVFKTVSVVDEGAKIVVGEEFQEWVFVKAPKEYSGWLEKKNLKKY